MTLILTLGNSDQVIQISDRRLSWQGTLRDDESNKAGVLLCSNARLAFGFTGIAQCGLFRTQEWLLDTLNGVRALCSDALGAVTRLRDSATDTFSRHPALRILPHQDRQLSIMFSGYLNHHVPPRIGYAVVTNDETFPGREMDPQPPGCFRLVTISEREKLDHDVTFVERVGSWRAMTNEDAATLRSLLAARKPASAIIGAAVKLVRQMADRPAAQNTIGKQLTVIRIPRDLERPVQSDYSTAVNSFESFGPDLVTLGPGEGSFAMKGLVVSMSSPVGSPALVAVPKVGRNAPCPCGSGKKYKRCHGRAPLPSI